MPGKDLFPNSSNGRGAFRYGTNRKVELTLKQELDDVAQKSLSEIAANREYRRNAPLDEEEVTSRKLKPAFIPQKVREKRKTEPVFHENILNKERKKDPSFKLIPNIPQYNPLDKGVSKDIPSPDKTKKYPYSKENTITTEVMRRPHVTSLGVVPTRTSLEVPMLKVMMEGKPAMTGDDLALDEIAVANKMRPVSPVTPDPSLKADRKDAIKRDGEPLTPREEKKKKPAILSTEGTLQKVAFVERQKPVPHPPSTYRPKGGKARGKVKSAVSITSSLKSENIHLPDDAVYSQYDDVIAGMDEDLETAVQKQEPGEAGPRSRASSTASVKSTKDLLDEAKRIAAPGSEPLYKQHIKKSPRKEKKDKKKESKKSKAEKGKAKTKEKEQEESDQSRPRSERSVDEIIASLRAQSGASKVVSDADRRIQQIMDRVMSRASAVLSDQDTTSFTTETPDTRKEVAPPIPEIKPIPEVETGSEQDARSSSHTPYQAESEASSPSLGGDLHTGYSSSDEKKEITVPEQIPEEDVTQIPAEDIVQDEETKRLLAASAELARTQDVGDLQIPPLQLPDDIVPKDTQEAPITIEFTTEEEQELLDIKKAWDDLMAPPNPTHEDIISIQGKQTEIMERVPPVAGSVTSKYPVNTVSVSFLSSWKPTAGRKYEPFLEEKIEPKNVHHFCTLTSDYQLPDEFRNVGRKYHTPGRFGVMPDQPYRFGSGGPSLAGSGEEEERSATRVSDSLEAEEKRIASAARRVLDEVKEENEDSFEVWQQRAEEVTEPAGISIEGTRLSLKSDESRLYWTPAPPKLDVPPAKVKEFLFPEYRPRVVIDESRELSAMRTEEMEDSEESSDEEDVIDAEALIYEEQYRVIYNKSKSSEDLTVYIKAAQQREQDIKDGKIDPYCKRIKKQTAEEEEAEKQEEEETSTRESTPIGPMAGLFGGKTVDILPVFAPLRRCISDPAMIIPDDDTLLVPQDYNMAMEEISKQKASIKQMKYLARVEEERKLHEEQAELQEDAYEDMETAETVVIGPLKKKDEPTPAELALEAGRSYVILPKKKKSKRKRAPVSMGRLDDIEKFLKTPPNVLTRSQSMEKMPVVVARELRVPGRVRSRIRKSLPDLLDFDSYSSKRSMPEDADVREWVRDIWNVWFDQVFPPPQSDSDDFMEEEGELDETAQKEDKVDKKRKASISSSLSESLSVIEPIEETEENMEVLQIMYEEVEKLSADIEANSKPRAFDFCRRGALCRKLGMVKRAQADLDRAISMEPLLLDAYWHRHLLYILQDKKQAALEDLQFLLKHSKNHAGAYRSMAEIYRKQGDLNLAIFNYTRAIKLDPKDHEAYFHRAEMYEKKGEMLMALEDYARATRIMPTRTDAILKHGMYYFEKENWTNAINDFTDLLKVDPLNAMARIYRGRAYAKLNQWSPAVEDLSAAIHLDPNSWQALYYRACILRKAHPKHALHDYSVSLLINDTDENVMSYLHRGILYNGMNKPEDAIPDFESVLKLNKDIACAHVNLGLIFMNHYENYHRAIKKFTAAIKVDPTYVRAYVCRGEAFHKVHDLKLALKDFTRAIHLRPDVHHYYMYRGQLVLEMGNLDLAAFCVRHASELSSDSALGQMPTQQAVVQSFLKNYGKAIDALLSATRVKPIAPMFMLLGKTQMKAKEYKDAIESFDKALQLYKPWKPREPWPIEAAESHFLVGMCNTELRNYVAAMDSFTTAIKLDSNYAEAFYQRGIARMKMRLSKGIQDFNKALAINPKIFQAYLSRACYYGSKGNYTKAILNCNEAIKLQPQSVRSYLYRGALKYHIKAFDLAIRDLTKATSIDSMCGLAYFNRAVCYQEKKDYERALTDYGIVLLLGEDLILKVLINRGLLYFERKDYINALYDFKMAANVNKGDHRILHTLGLCYHKMNRLKESVGVFTACIEKNPFFLDGIIARGNVYMDYGNKEGIIYARRDYERALHLDPVCLPARVNLAYTLQVSGKFMQAWHQFTAAIAIKPTFKPALEGRAIINLQMSDTFAAFQDINASLKVSPSAELYTNRGVINQFMNDGVNAMRDYQSAIKVDPTYSLAYFNAANVYFHTRHFRQALDYYSKTVKYNPKDESAFLNRAITKVMLRDTKGALEDFKLAISLSPHSAHMYFNRGNLYATIEQYENAEKDYTKSLTLQPDDAMVLKRRADVRGKLGQRENAIKDYKRAVDIQSRAH